MKNIKKSLVVVMAFAALTFTFTACSKSAKDSADEAVEEVEEMTEEVIETADSMATEAADAVEGATTTSTSGNYAWSSDLDAWVLSGNGSKTITLDGISGEGELSAEGRAQLDVIASILESNEGLNAVIKGHTPADQKIGNGKPRAVWTKTKLIIGHDAVGNKISTEGVGSNEPIEGVDANDPSQKRITVTFNK